MYFQVNIIYFVFIKVNSSTSLLIDTSNIFLLFSLPEKESRQKSPVSYNTDWDNEWSWTNYGNNYLRNYIIRFRVLVWLAPHYQQRYRLLATRALQDKRRTDSGAPCDVNYAQAIWEHQRHSKPTAIYVSGNMEQDRKNMFYPLYWSLISYVNQSQRCKICRLSII